ncbi:MAG TPA: protein phosphatase 2C domain-containing protein [Pseudonocardiaceae bacterium]|nr:protein phosphatase 2C domain-containing protein [Pseudonocardiaceae bacterium]
MVGEPITAFEPRASPHHRPDTVLDGWATPRFTVRAASVRGYLHRFHGNPREDDFAVAAHANSGAVVAAVADGVSGGPLAHLGATLAGRAAVDFLLRCLDSGTDAVDWPELVRCASWSLVEYAARQNHSTGTSPEAAERLLATTLLAALVRPGTDGSGQASVVRVGDSSAWVLRAGEWCPVFPDKIDPMADVFTSEVVGLPRVPESVAAVDVDLAPGSVLVLGTDGFGDPLGDGRGEVGRLFADTLAEPPPALGLAHVLDFTRETFDDDRTVVAVWPNGSAPP